LNGTSGTEPADRELRSSRLFAVPRETLWEAFRRPSQLAQWWGPAGFRNEFHEFDFRPGGVWRLTMRGADGKKYPMKKVFVEMSAPERIVLDHIDPVHGFRMFMTYEDRAGKTELAWRVLFHSAEEAARVSAFFLAANEENFDRLAAHVGSPAGGRGTENGPENPTETRAG
jgi:uncharacterized protein YndB with AHSA1/START domain